MSDKEELNVGNIRPDGIETIEGGLENYQAENQEEEQEEFDLTFDEKKKLLRAFRKTQEDAFPVTDEEVDSLTDEQMEELKEFAKFRERKAILKFVTRRKNITDEEVKNLTDEEVEEMIAKSYVMAQHFSYNPKKDFGKKYKKKRQNRNKMARRSRAANRK
jgi:hypothetical protein